MSELARHAPLLRTLQTRVQLSTGCDNENTHFQSKPSPKPRPNQRTLLNVKLSLLDFYAHTSDHDEDFILLNNGK